MNHTHSFFVFKAGAGSGKTFNLVKQYLLMALADARTERLQMLFRSILAITFTNKAANEMKERIVSSLIDLAHGKPIAMAAQLRDELQLSADELQRRATVVTNAVLHHYSDLSVCTIDSFMQRLVRTFARELQLPLNFNIELDADYITSLLVDRLMALVGTEGRQDLTEVLCAYGNAQMDEGKSSNIERLLSDTASRLFHEEAAAYLQRLEPYTPAQFQAAYEKLRKDNRDFLARCRRDAGAALDCCHAHGLGADDFTGKSRSSIYAWLLKIKNAGGKLPDISKAAQSANDSGEADPKAKLPCQVEQAIMQAVHTVLEGERDYNTRSKLMGCYYNLAVLGELQRQREIYYADNELTDFTEISHKINEVVKESPVPYLYERLGDRYRHFLIDEFQDTSQEQWHNLLPLVLNGVAAQQRSLIVGDAKQAIYRFRQGDVRQFLALAQPKQPDNATHDADLSLLAQVSRTVPLSTNYRTRPMVVHFNNRFFAWLIHYHYGDNALLQEIYPDAATLLEQGIAGAPESFGQQSPAGKEGGSVQLAFYSKDKEADDPNSPLYSTAYEMIQQQQALGYDLGDITVLADKNKTLSAFSSYLAERHVRSASSESMLLSGSTVVCLLHALLRHLHSPDERMHQLHVLHHLWQLGVVPDSYTEQFLQKEESDDDAAAHYAFSLQNYLQTLGIDFPCRRLQSLPLYELCEELLRIFPLDGKESAFAASFLNFVARYSNSHRQSLGEFLDYLERKLPSLSSRTPADSNAIRLMSVHKSKGLESPVVLYLIPKQKSRSSARWVQLQENPLTDIDVALVSYSKESTLFDTQREKERQENEMDNVNRTYVAFTRPKDKLLLVVEEDLPGKKNEEPSRSLNRQLYEYAGECVAGGLCLKDTERNLFLFGHDEAREQDDNTDSTERLLPLSRLSFPSWQERILVADSTDALLPDSVQERIRHGLEMHDLLSHIHHAGDVDRALTRYARLHACDDEHCTTLRHAVEQLLQHAETSRFFAPEAEVKTECSLCYRGNTLRPDRLVLLPDKTWVVDFKTGSEHEAHRQQVADYCHAMKAMGYPAVSGYLIYLATDHEPRLVNVACTYNRAATF